MSGGVPYPPSSEQTWDPATPAEPAPRVWEMPDATFLPDHDVRALAAAGHAGARWEAAARGLDWP